MKKCYFLFFLFTGILLFYNYNFSYANSYQSSNNSTVTVTVEDGLKKVTTKDKTGKIINEKQYNDKGILLQEKTPTSNSIYSYKTGKLYQKYVGEDLYWYDINTGAFLAKTISDGKGNSKTYNSKNQFYTGTVSGHMYSVDYTLKYKNGDIDVSSIFNTLVQAGIIDKNGELLTTPYYYFNFLIRLRIIDSEYNPIDQKALKELSKIVDP